MKAYEGCVFIYYSVAMRSTLDIPIIAISNTLNIRFPPIVFQFLFPELLENRVCITDKPEINRNHLLRDMTIEESQYLYEIFLCPAVFCRVNPIIDGIFLRDVRRSYEVYVGYFHHC